MIIKFVRYKIEEKKIFNKKKVAQAGGAEL